MVLRRILYLVVALVAVGFAQTRAAEPPSLAGLSYNPSGINTQAQMEAGVSEDAIRRDLETIKTVTGNIRTYSTGMGLDRVPGIVRALGLRMSLGLYIGPDAAKNDEEIARAIRLIGRNADVIDRVFVGNETIEHGGLKPAQIIAYIKRVKDAVPGMRVGTAESWHVWRAHPELGDAVDFIGLHLLPYWDGVAAKDAPNYVMRRYREIATTFPGKPIVIAETGWPSAGDTRQAAVPSQAAQTEYVRAFITKAKGMDYFIVEAFDQPWKATSHDTNFEPGVGPHWGAFDTNRKPKFDLTP